MAETTSTADVTPPDPQDSTASASASETVTTRQAPTRGRPLCLHSEDDHAPQHAHILMLSAWSTILVLVGLLVAARIVAEMLLNSGPGWLVPTVITVGCAGVVAAGSAFTMIHRPRWTRLAMGGATTALAVNLTLILTFL